MDDGPIPQDGLHDGPHDGLVVGGGIVIPRHELVWRFSRSGGPGGQSVNTSDSRVQLVFDVGASPSIPEPMRARAVRRLGDRLREGRLTITASEQRSQLRNREAAERRLVEVLGASVAPPAKSRRPTKPSKASVDRRIQAKKGRGLTKRLRQTRDLDG